MDVGESTKKRPAEGGAAGSATSEAGDAGSGSDAGSASQQRRSATPEPARKKKKVDPVSVFLLIINFSTL